MQDWTYYAPKVFLGCALGAFILVFIVTAMELVYNTPSLFEIMFSKRKPKTERLCGYHISSVNRRGLAAVVDSNNCEGCKKEKKA